MNVSSECDGPMALWKCVQRWSARAAYQVLRCRKFLCEHKRSPIQRKWPKEESFTIRYDMIDAPLYSAHIDVAVCRNCASSSSLLRSWSHALRYTLMQMEWRRALSHSKEEKKNCQRKTKCGSFLIQNDDIALLTDVVTAAAAAAVVAVAAFAKGIKPAWICSPSLKPIYRRSSECACVRSWFCRMSSNHNTHSHTNEMSSRMNRTGASLRVQCVIEIYDLTNEW